MPEPINPIAERVRAGLYQHYKQYETLERLFADDAEPRVSMSDCYINLALVHKSHLTQQEHALDSNPPVNQAAQDEPDIKPSHERLYVVPEPITPEQLFAWSDEEEETVSQPKKPQPTKVLVSGLPGSGKTTFFEHCVHEWKEGRLWPQFKAVFLFKLRLVAEWASHRRETPTLGNLIREQCLGGVDLEKPTIEELNQFLRHNKDYIAFLCDGYDEILGEQSHELSRLNQLLQDISQYTYVVVSSRPRGLTVIEPQHKVPFDRHLENMGLTDENIKKHVTRRLQDEAQGEACLQFLRQHPSIWGTCHNIIHLELFLFLWDRGHLNATDKTVWTLSRLYGELLARLCEYNTNKHPNLAELIQPGGPDYITIALRFLDYLAHAGMQGNKLVFHSDALRAALNAALQDYHIEPNHALYRRILQAAVEGGLLKAIQTRGALLDKTYYFVHLSFQEFLAARCAKRRLSQLNTPVSDDQLSQVIHNKYAPRLQLMWWFTAGLLYQDWELASTDKKNTSLAVLLRFYSGLLAKPRDITGRKHLPLLAHCLDECEADDSIPLLKSLLGQQVKWFDYTASSYLKTCPQVIAHPKVLANLLDHARNNYGCSSFTGRRKLAINILSSLSNPSSEMEKFFLNMMEEESWIVRQDIVYALGRLSNPSSAVVNALQAAAMGDKHSGVRRIAIRAIGNLSNPSSEVVDTLLAVAVQDEDCKVRSTAVEVLGCLSNLSSAMVDALLATVREEAMREKGIKVCNTINKILSRLLSLSLVTVDALLAAVRDEDREVDKFDVAVLNRLSNPSPVMISTLLAVARNEDGEVCNRIMETLSYLSSPSTAMVDTLVVAARDKDDWVRRQAIEVLGGRLPNPSSAVVDALLAATRDKDDWVRRQAIEVLGRLPNPSSAVVDALLAAAQYKDGWVSQQAIEALGHATNPPSAVMNILLAVAARGEDRKVCSAAIEILGYSDLPLMVVVPMLSTIQEKEIEARNPTVEILSRLLFLSLAALDSLLAALRDKDRIAGFAAVEALDRLSNLSSAVMDTLLAATRDKDGWVRLQAIEVLGRLPNPSSAVVDALLAATRDKDDWVRRQAIEVLGRLPNPSSAVVDALLAATRDKDDWVRRQAIEVLGRLPNPSSAVVDALLAATRDKDDCVRQQAIEALGRLPNPSEAVMDVLLATAVGDEDSLMRRSATRILGDLSNPSAVVVNALLVAVQNKDHEARFVTVKALGYLSNPSSAVVDALLTVVAQDENGEVRSVAVWALGRLLNPSSAVMDVLLTAAEKDEDRRVRFAAIEALGRLSNPSPVGVNTLLSVAAQDKNDGVRNSAVGLLSRLSNLSSAVMDTLLAAAQDEVQQARCSAAEMALGLLDSASAYNKFNLAPTPILKQLLCVNGSQLKSPSQFPFHRHFVTWCYKQQGVSLILDRQTVVISYKTTVRSVDLPEQVMQALCTELKYQAQFRKQLLELLNQSGYNSNKMELAVLQAERPHPFVVSNTIWVVHLARKKNSQHVFLLIEGLDNEEHIVKRYELIQLGTHLTLGLRLYDSSSGLATIQKNEDFLDSLKRHAPEYLCRSWEMISEVGQQLIKQLEDQVNSRLRYAISGGNTLSGNRVYNCLTWAEEQLRNQGINPSGHWFDFVVALPSNHVPARQGCLVM